MSEMIERLADLEHQQWAHWTKYMLDNLTPENIERWRGQIETPYADLTEKEKEIDREWAVKSLKATRDEATEEMVVAAYKEACTHVGPSGGMKTAYKAMIDEALKDEKCE